MQEMRIGDGTTTMQVFKFNVGARSVERAVADAIGQGITARRGRDDAMPQRFADLIARLDDAAREQAQRLQSRKGVEE